MAQETVIHRIDAELATSQPVASVPGDLAVDGIDELLKVFASFSVKNWPRSFAEVLAASPGWTYLFRTDDAVWQVRLAPEVFDVQDGPVAGSADVTISGAPEALLRWVWNRDAPGAAGVVADGPAEAVALLKRCIVVATQ
jgi:hypothetical protein